MQEIEILKSKNLFIEEAYLFADSKNMNLEERKTLFEHVYSLCDGFQFDKFKKFNNALAKIGYISESLFNLGSDMSIERFGRTITSHRV